MSPPSPWSEATRPAGRHLTAGQASVFLAAISGAALLLRLYRLDAQSVWYDESFAIAQAVKPWGALFDALVREGGRHPPLHYALLHGWFGVVGFGAFQARLLSALLGTAAVPLLYRLARRVASRPAALRAALLLAVSQMAVYFSQEARAYMAAETLSLVAGCAFLALLARPTMSRALGLSGAVLALLATHYYGLATVLALIAYWLLFPGPNAPLVWRRLVLAGVVTVAVYAPWPLALRGSAEAQPSRIFRERDVSERPTMLAPVMALHRFNNGKLTSIEAESSAASVLLGLALFTGPLAVAFWQRRPRGSRRARTPAEQRDWQGLVLGGLLAALPVLLAIAAGLLGATFNYRHYSFAVPGYCLAVAVGWQVCFPRPVLRTAWLVAALVVSAVALQAVYTAPTKPDYRTALAGMAAVTAAGDCAVVRPGIWNDALPLPWDIYYRDRPRPRVLAPAALPEGLADCARVWMLWDRTWWMNPDEAGRASATALLAAPPAGFALEAESRHPALEWRRYRRLSP